MFFDEKQHSLSTPELVSVRYDIAGVGSRFVGIVIDTLIIYLIVALAMLALAIFASFIDVGDSVEDIASITLKSIAGVLIASAILLYFIITWGYHIFYEVVRGGQTPGKRMSGTQVVKLDGSPVSLKDSLVRNLLRIADFLPAFYLAGIISHFSSPNGQRLGDYAAGTAVIRTRGRSYLSGKPGNSAYQPAGLTEPDDSAAPSPGADGESQSTLPGGRVTLTNNEYQLIMNFLQRADSLEGKNRHAIASRLAAQIARKYALPQQGMPENPEHFLRIIMDWEK